jgi:hypothetical protein
MKKLGKLNLTKKELNFLVLKLEKLLIARKLKTKPKHFWKIGGTI